jgi:hypothetical protein
VWRAMQSCTACKLQRILLPSLATRTHRVRRCLADERMVAGCSSGKGTMMAHLASWRPWRTAGGRSRRRPAAPRWRPLCASFPAAARVRTARMKRTWGAGSACCWLSNRISCAGRCQRPIFYWHVQASYLKTGNAPYMSTRSCCIRHCPLVSMHCCQQWFVRRFTLLLCVYM